MSRSSMRKSGSPRRRSFETTRWSLVAAAADSRAAESSAALEELCRGYWYPLYAYLRRSGLARDDAEDLVQGFFVHLFGGKALRKASAARGRFRSFLLASLKNFIANERARARAKKRGGGQIAIRIDVDLAEELLPRESFKCRTPEQVFVDAWANRVLEQSLDSLGVEMATRGHAVRFQKLRRFLVGSAGAGYGDIAADLGMTRGAVKVAVHRMRRRFGELLRQQVAETVRRPEEVDREIEYLLGAVETEATVRRQS